MDLTETVLTRADQLNAEDMLPTGRFGGPATFTITGVSRGNAEQPVEIHVAEYDQPFKPCKTVRRILIDLWGADGKAYIGRRLTLFCDPKVRFGPETVGGIRVEAMSDIGDKPRTSVQKVSRGQRKPFTIKPLPSGVNSAELLSRIATAASLDDLDVIAADLKARNLGAHKVELQKAWTSRKAALTAAPTTDDDALDAAQEAEGNR